jgi:hypothetical protein
LAGGSSAMTGRQTNNSKAITSAENRIAVFWKRLTRQVCTAARLLLCHSRNAFYRRHPDHQALANRHFNHDAILNPMVAVNLQTSTHPRVPAAKRRALIARGTSPWYRGVKLAKPQPGRKSAGTSRVADTRLAI